MRGCPSDKATIEHLHRHPPFYWPEVPEEWLVIACGSCNSSRGQKLLRDWFQTPFCEKRRISSETVSPKVRAYLETDASLL